MSRYIDADKLMLELNDWWYSQTKIESQNIPYDDDISVTIKEAMESVKEQPTADVRENVRGEWLPHPIKDIRDFDICSVCGIGIKVREYGIQDGREWVTEYSYRFCPHCGAQMK